MKILITISIVFFSTLLFSQKNVSNALDVLFPTEFCDTNVTFGTGAQGSIGILSDWSPVDGETGGLVKITGSGSIKFTLKKTRYQNKSLDCNGNFVNRTMFSHNILFNTNFVRTPSLLSLITNAFSIGRLSSAVAPLTVVYQLPQTSQLVAMGDFIDFNLGYRFSIHPKKYKSMMGSSIFIGGTFIWASSNLNLSNPSAISNAAQNKLEDILNENGGSIFGSPDFEREIETLINDLDLFKITTGNFINDISSNSNFVYDNVYGGLTLGISVNSQRFEVSGNYSIIKATSPGGESVPNAQIEGTSLNYLSKETIGLISDFFPSYSGSIAKQEQTWINRFVFSSTFFPKKDSRISLFTNATVSWGSSEKASKSSGFSGGEIPELNVVNRSSKIVFGINYSIGPY